MDHLATDTTDVVAAVAAQSWYHTIDLPGGTFTPGHYDKRPTLRRIPFPASLEGKRCLDVGTSDGFWAFEMERRGAAEVIALDIDDPAHYDWPEPRPGHLDRPANRGSDGNRGFEVAHRALGSKVERVNCRVYDIDPAALGSFDFVFIGSLLLHLRDPILALSCARTVVGGELMSVDIIGLVETIRRPRTPTATLVGKDIPRWWTPNLAGYRRMLTAAGFEIDSSGWPVFIPFGVGFDPPLGPRGWVKRARARDRERIVFELGARRFGAPAAWARCRSAVAGPANPAEVTGQPTHGSRQ